MSVIEKGTSICGLPAWCGIVRNDTAAYINNILIAAVNVPAAMFAFLSNLAIIVAVIKNPSLQKPCNILLCSLAFADCLTGITAQPMFVVWRVFVSKAQQSCSHQILVFEIYYTINIFTLGLSMANFLSISFDRCYALSRPLEYLANATKKGAVKVAIRTSIMWLLCTILLQLILPRFPDLKFIAGRILGVLFIVVPIANYMRMLFAVRLHNSQLGDAVASQQMSAILRREKRVALDMCIVAILLLVSLTPSLTVTLIRLRYPLVYSILLPWTITVALMTSCINPLIYFGRNKHLRNALKSIMNVCLHNEESP